MEWIKINESDSEFISDKISLSCYSGRVLSIYKGAANWENGWSPWSCSNQDCYSVRLEAGVRYVWLDHNQEDYNFIDNFYKSFIREDRLKYILREDGGIKR
jgi:hypothetical protein